MKLLLRYSAIAIAFLIISSGVLVATCKDMYDSDILWFILAHIPMTLLFLIGVMVNDFVAVPRLLLRNRYLAYCLVMFITAYSLVIIALGYEYLGRTLYGLPQRINDFTSVWFIIDSIGNSMLIFMMYLGLGAWRLFISWKQQSEKEKQTATNLSAYLKEIKYRLNPGFILGRISFIKEALARNATEAVDAIRDLSEYLRCQLYELPSPPSHAAGNPETMNQSAVADFIVSDKWRVCRHVVFQSMLLIIAFNAFFDTPDSPDFSTDRMFAMLSELALLDAIVYVDILLFHRNFKRHHNLRRYLMNVAILIPVILLIMIGVQLLTYEPMVYTFQTPVVLSAFAALSSMLTLSMFLAGITAILLLQDWISGQRRVTLLNAETVRQEYAFLKKQINPHFLFNVLNNIGILSADEPDEAADMLYGLQKLVEYQFAETSNNSTTLLREIDFLDSYLALESTRIEPFGYSISSECNPEDMEIPTLLFIPFVENAVKHSSVVDGRRVVKLTFRSHGGRLVFECVNTFRPVGNASASRPGGLGISNTLRRLNLLYADAHTYSSRVEAGQYIATLSIPV